MGAPKCLVPAFLSSAWAAQTPELGEGPADVPSGEVVYFLLDDAEEQALQRLQDDVKPEIGAEWLRAITRPARRCCSATCASKACIT
jgi:hypothetical protein